MKPVAFLVASGLAVMALISVADKAWTASHATKVSENGLYSVSYTSSLDPIEINRMHEWMLHVETADGEPVEDAVISVDGGMPAHNHGLPTQPRVTEYLGNGDYRVQGLRFQMRGTWQVSFEIREGGRGDTVTFELAL